MTKMNDQPPPYEEISSSAPAAAAAAAAAPVVYYGSSNADQQMFPTMVNTTAGGRPTNTPPSSAVDASNDKLLIPSTRRTVLHFPYQARLSQMGITATEWESFTSAIASAATLSGAQKAKAITAAIGTGWW